VVSDRRERPQAGSPGRLVLVYVGAGAATAPAASLRALGGAGAVFVPAGVPEDLHELVAGAAAGAQILALDPADLEPVLGAPQAVVAVAGAAGPALARALAAAATDAGREVEHVPPQPDFDDCLIGQELVSLQRVTRILRRECPWDRVQTSSDIVSYSLEEVYELADAIAEDDVGEEHGELGDVLFQVYFLSLLLCEQGVGDLGTVAAAIERKLIRRHAHIFGDVVAETPAAVRGQWERIKREQEGREGIFHNVPSSLPALVHARKLQARAAEVGFDWSTAHEAFPKIAEEHGELEEALAAHRADHEFDDPRKTLDVPEGASRPADGSQRPELRHDPAVRHEVGDLLFAVVNVARKAGVDPELALRAASQRFERRVCGAERLAATEDREWAKLSLDEQESYYQRAKELERDEREEPQP